MNSFANPQSFPTKLHNKLDYLLVLEYLLHDTLYTVGAHIFGRLSVVENNLAKYREASSILPIYMEINS